MSDDETTKTKEYSATHWNLHRNSLLISLVFLISSLPNINISNPFLGLVISPNLIKMFPILACTAALYALLVYWIEWKRGPAEELTERIVELGSLKDQIDNAMKEIIKPLENSESIHRSILNAFMETNQQVNMVLGVIKSNDMHAHGEMGYHFVIESIVERISDEIESIISNNEATNMILHNINMANPSKSRVYNPRLSGVELKLRTCLSSDIGPLLNERDNFLSSNLVLFPEVNFEKLRSEIDNNIDISAESMRRIKSEDFGKSQIYRTLKYAELFDKIRTNVIGLYVPIGLFAIALAHMIGKLWCIVLPDMLTILLKILP